MTKAMSVITNCQGPVLVQRFLAHASAQFKTRYHLAGVHQIQLVQAAHMPQIEEQLAQSDVILAQPLISTPFEALQLDNLRAFAHRSGKQLILFPALHFSALTPGIRATPKRGPGYPFGATEDLVLAGCYALGLPVATAAHLYHNMRWLPKGRPAEIVEAGLDQFRTREVKLNTDIPVSDFYEANWRNLRLHYIKSHPTASVYRHLLTKLAPLLGLDDLDLEATRDLRGNAIFALPHMDWLRAELELSFDEDPGQGRLNNEDVPFATIIAALYAYYDTLGRKAVLRDIKAQNAHLLALLSKASKV